MINATVAISTDVISSTSFNGTVTFPMDVTNFAVDDVQLTAVDGNGITNVVLTVSEQLPSSYSLDFQLPADAEGEFTVEITGTVLPDGETTEQPIVPNPQTSLVIYDTSVAVVATWGTPDYTVGEAQIGIPITFASAIVFHDDSAIRILPVAPLVTSDLDGVYWTVNGSGTDWVLNLTVPLDLDGEVSIDITGQVFKVSSHVYDTVTIAALTLPVNTIVPEVIRREQSGNYTRGEIYDVVWQFKVPVEFYDTAVYFPNEPDATNLDYFVFSGAQLGQPTIYVWTGTGFPSLPLPETLPAEWAQWTNGVPIASDVYLMRYPDVPENTKGCITCGSQVRHIF